ncbi:MAG: HEAT repeat domain-containing protein [Lewinellaceae bacterium]|nr:HEAT repeat domain-containing protein [Saprospiraceae bacterium]MCB9269402.1 HEAT repeat domain-containing protein [Lewinellaceae bacterium]HPG06976.1 HEAT repeat domain-containing protein [Saprospiraceae bacterium]HPQ98488.1 HEAT repeat domain-containing protein [Saprospiraceae bacterium]
MENTDPKRKEIEEAERLLDQTPIPELTESLDRKFYDFLDAAITTRDQFPQRSRTALYWYAVAAGIALFVMGWLGGSVLSTRNKSSVEITGLSGEVRDLRESLALTMIQQPLPGKRIQAINMLADMKNPDDKIYATLLSTLNHDPNDNVRLVALEALAKHVENDQVMAGMVEAIGQQQTSPVVLLRLTELMALLGEKRALPVLKTILEKPDLNYNIKTQIYETVQGLS